MACTLSGVCPLHHSNLAPHVLPSYSAFSPRAVSRTPGKAMALYRTLSCTRSRVTGSQSAHINKLELALPTGAAQELSSLLKRMALLSAPLLLTELVLPSAATAFGLDGITSSQCIKFFPLADLDPAVASVLLRVLGPVFASLNFLFIIRIVMSWYPQLPVDKFPYIIAFAPTEPVLEPTRRLVPPVGGVDVSPVIWVALMSFLNEVLLGQQGLLVLLSQQQG